MDLQADISTSPKMGSNNLPISRRRKPGFTLDDLINGQTISWTAINDPDIFEATASNASPYLKPSSLRNNDHQQVEEAEEEDSRQALIEECEDILTDNPALLINDTLLKVAGVFTNAEIVEHVKAARPLLLFSSKLVSERLTKAISHVAKQEDKTRDQVKSELEAARRINGFTDRKNAHAIAMRSASLGLKKLQP